MADFVRVTHNPNTGEMTTGGGATMPGNYGVSSEEVAAYRAQQGRTIVEQLLQQKATVQQVRVNTAPAEHEPRTAFGSPVGGRALRDDDRVMIGGVEVRVREARRMGWVEEAATGTDPFARG